MSDPENRSEDAPDLLVFLANDTLDGEDRQRQLWAVDADPQLQAELAALKAVRAKMQAEEGAASPGEFGLARLMREVNANPGQPKPAKSSPWKLAAIAAMALLAVQVSMQQFATGPDAELADGGPEAPQTGPVLTVAFAPTATEQDIRALLLDLDLAIVSGPSALGLYTLAARDPEAAAHAQARLAEATGIVDSVEATRRD